MPIFSYIFYALLDDKKCHHISLQHPTHVCVEKEGCLSRDIKMPFCILTWLKPTAPVFQFFTSSNGNVGMNGDAFAVAAVGDGVNPGAKMLESVIGTLTIRRLREKKMKKRC